MATSSASSIQFHETCNSARELFLKYARGPAPADQFAKQRWIMCSLHLQYTEAFQNIYNKADTVTLEQEQPFLFYCWTATEAVHHHHHIEEDIYFKGLQPEVDIDIAADHAAFTNGLHNLEEYIKGAAGPTIPGNTVKAEDRLSYDSAKLKHLLEEMAKPFFHHLMEEIDKLEPETLRASGLTAEKLITIQKEIEAHIRSTMNVFVDGVFTFSHMPPDCGFPEAPWFVGKVLVPYVFYWKHKQAWQFLPKFDSQKASTTSRKDL